MTGRPNGPQGPQGPKGDTGDTWVRRAPVRRVASLASGDPNCPNGGASGLSGHPHSDTRLARRIRRAWEGTLLIPTGRTHLTLIECIHLAGWGALLDVAEETGREQPCAARYLLRVAWRSARRRTGWPGRRGSLLASGAMRAQSPRGGTP